MNGGNAGTKSRRSTLAKSPVYCFCAGAFIGIMLSCMLRQSRPAFYLESLDDAVPSLTQRQTDSPTTLLRIDVPPTDYDIKNQPNVTVRATTKLFATLPPDKRKTFYSHTSKICHGMVRALRTLGWTRASKRTDARLIWTYVRVKSWYASLEPWQRYNHVPETFHWNHKDKMAQGFRLFSKTTNRPLYFLPETYNLNKKREREEYRQRLKDGGTNYPWVLKRPNVNQGKGIAMLGPNSKELENVFETAEG